ncbi:hypothetical protein JAO73_17530 [Hymenobacter sp. BT523]|uniref:hypothetical protein n=1 Tax=Hymenobacter sp. BT523 TaxID=2795725 RepID=UPI0018ED13E8|nr:hypothetical protein [Hymenobacter sp. BT523]MBJ6110828.1 hypothetical protein [Hymenobacter sp. BT523]
MNRTSILIRRAAALALLGAGLLGSCQKKDGPSPNSPTICVGYPPACGTPATVRDLSGLDGCGKVLELANGQRLEPHGAAWSTFSSTNGQRVLIGFTPTQAASVCMVGQPVDIICIQSAN